MKPFPAVSTAKMICSLKGGRMAAARKQLPAREQPAFTVRALLSMCCKQPTTTPRLLTTQVQYVLCARRCVGFSLLSEFLIASDMVHATVRFECLAYVRPFLLEISTPKMGGDVRPRRCKTPGARRLGKHTFLGKSPRRVVRVRQAARSCEEPR